MARTANIFARVSVTKYMMKNLGEVVNLDLCRLDDTKALVRLKA